MKGKDSEFIEGSLEKGFEAFIQRAMRNHSRVLRRRYVKVTIEEGHFSMWWALPVVY